MIKIEKITAGYREYTVLNDVSFTVSNGTFTGVIGPNGAGKTTLLKTITGIKKPFSGKVRLDGSDIETLSRRDIAQIMAVVPQSSFIPPLFSVEEVIGLGRYARQKNRFRLCQQDFDAVRSAMEKTNTTDFRDRSVGELSGGERQEVIIARALAQEPKILLLDEPTASLDIKHQLKIMNLIRELITAEELTALIIIHDLNMAARYCDRLVLLHKGKILVDGTPENVLTEDNLRIAYEVETSVRYNDKTESLEVTVLDSVDSVDESVFSNTRTEM